MIKMKNLIVALLTMVSVKSFAQTDTSKSILTFSGYLETYYSYDFGQPNQHNRPAFIYSHNRHHEINLNLGFVKAAYTSDKVRANLAVATGTYMNANYAAEADVLKNIYESNVGVKISKNKNLWLDAGVFSSHLGFESAVGKDNWTLTRSLFADNSPYFETGAKISYTTDNKKWFISGLILNGWQRIQRVDGNNTPSFGHQLVYKPNSKVTLNSGSFIGNDKADSVKQMRFFHNFYGIFQITEKFALTAGVDIGAEQIEKGSNDYNTWYTPIAVVKYSPTDKHNMAVRVEYYSDENGVIIGTNTSNGFKTWGYSINYDYLISNNVMWRVEGRGFSSEDKVFKMNDDHLSNDNYFVTTSLAIAF